MIGVRGGMVLVTLAFIAGAPLAHAETTVVNSVSVSSNSGGNTSTESTVEGESRSSIMIESTVNGETTRYAHTATGTGSVSQTVSVTNDGVEATVATGSAAAGTSTVARHAEYRALVMQLQQIVAALTAALGI